jgi:hypothetical protein
LILLYPQQDAQVARPEFLDPNADLVDLEVAPPVVKAAWVQVAQVKCK